VSVVPFLLIFSTETSGEGRQDLLAPLCVRHCLCDYNIYLNQILYRAQTPHCEHDEMCQIQLTWKSNMGTAAILNFGGNVNNSEWIKISAPNFMARCIMAMQRWPRHPTSKPTWWLTRYVIKWMSRNTSISGPWRALNVKVFGLSPYRTHLFTLLSEFLNLLYLSYEQTIKTAKL